MWRTIDNLFNRVDHLGTWEWFAVLLVVLAVGVFCMRGFGSVKNY